NTSFLYEIDYILLATTVTTIVYHNNHNTSPSSIQPVIVTDLPRISLIPDIFVILLDKHIS
ncbi:hypothetical protein AAAY25_09410, partial [Brotaphodocola catenula]|uniref:hypothetical protein n=1 Tax=Brotaphodocola catenula TaxID=2885361 RepID=UPI0032C0E249